MTEVATRPPTARKAQAVTVEHQRRFARAVLGPLAWCATAVTVSAVLSLVPGATTGDTAVPGVPVPSDVVAAGVSVARVLLVGAITATLGLNLVPLLFSPREQVATAPVRLRAYRGAAGAALCWLVCATASVVLQTADLAGTAAVTTAQVRTYVGGFGSGQALVCEMVVAAVALGAAVRGSRSGTPLVARLLVLCAAAGLLLLVAAGHSGERSERWHDLATVSLELHVFAAALWTGGLGATLALLSSDRALLSRALPRYSPLAGGCLLVVAVTGVLNAVVALSARPGTVPLPELLTSGYGLLVVLKAGCLCLLAAIGGHIRLRLLPAVRRADRTSVALWGCWELGIMGVAFGLAAVLARSAV